MSRALKGKGKGIVWLREHAAYEGDDCLIWPFFRLQPGGYGSFGFNGRLYYAHRMMCEMVHGAPPTPEHHAAHSCGRGHDGCVNPNHLSWKTASENLLDKRGHGTVIVNSHGNMGGLTPEQVAEIRRLKGQMSQTKIAERFGVKRGCIQYWHRNEREPARIRGIQWDHTR